MTDALAAIEAERLRLNLSVEHLARLMRCTATHLHDLRRGRRPLTESLANVATLGLRRYAAAPECGLEAHHALIDACYRLAVAALLEAERADALAAGRTPPVRPPLAGILNASPGRKAVQDPDWRAAAEIRALAWSVVTGALNVRNVELARAAGVSKSAVTQALQRAMDMRDDPALEARLARLEDGLIGGALA